MDYSTTFPQLGAEFQNMRTIEAVLNRFRDSDNADYASPLVQAVYDPDDDVEDAALSADKTFYKESVAGNLSSLHGNALATFEGSFFPVLDVELALDEIEKGKGAIDYDYDPVLLSSGQVAILKRRGRWGKLYDQMVADSETIKANVLTFGSFDDGPDNLGTLAVAGSPTFAGKDHTLSGVIRFICTDDTVDAPKITCQLELTKPLPDGTSMIQADNQITVGKSFEDGPTGLFFELDLSTLQKSGDAGSPIFSAEVFTKPSEGDTNKGIFYMRVTRQAADPYWLIEWFKNSDTANPLNLVQRKQISGLSGTVTGQVMLRTSVFSFTFSKTNAAADMAAAGNTRTVTYDIKTPRVGDFWTKTVSNNEAGNFATKLAYRYRASLNSVTPGETISDTLAASISMS